MVLPVAVRAGRFDKLARSTAFDAICTREGCREGDYLMVASSTTTESGVAGHVARFVAGAAIGPALFGGGLLRLVAVLLFGIAIGAIGAWLVHRWQSARCSACAVHRRPAVGRARVVVAGPARPVRSARRVTT
jgi:hypothetical protein